MILSEASFHTQQKTCAKMQKEEQKRKDVLNGNRECVANNSADEGARTHGCGHGGRLKFFKDGKFILELERAREGERVSWVSVPRKTYWPPQGTASSTPSYRQESSTSLSDDNSSIQSSPWQRDHSWKQTTPRKNQSKELTFLYRRPRGHRPPKSKKRRRPHDPVVLTGNDTNSPCNTKKLSLLQIIQTLLEKQTGSPRSEQVVSPRKRFLREMEKDKVQMEAEGGKRSRGKPSGLVCGKVPASGLANGSVEETKPKNSYSITSLLADDRKPKKSPGHSPSHFSPPGAAATAASVGQYPYPAATTPEERVFVDKLRSIELSADKRLYTSYSAPNVQPFTYYYPPYYPNYSRPYPGMPVVYPVPIPVRPEAPSCSWAAEPSRDTEHRDENIADMPLNLSKHGA